MPHPLAPGAVPEHCRAARTILAVSPTDTWGTAAGTRHGIAGPSVLAATGGAAILSKGVWRTSYGRQEGSTRVSSQWDPGPRVPPMDTQQP